jgi:hypothetical protein
MALTLAILFALILGLARFQRGVVVRFLNPTTYNPLKTSLIFERGGSYQVAGQVTVKDPQSAGVREVVVNLVETDPKRPGHRWVRATFPTIMVWGSTMYGPATTFSTTVVVPKDAAWKQLFLTAGVGDISGRYYEQGSDEGYDCQEVPVTIVPPVTPPSKP